MRNLLVIGVSILVSLTSAANDVVVPTVAEATLGSVKAAAVKADSTVKYSPQVSPAVKSCVAAADKARYACLANLSEKIQVGAAIIGGLLTASSMAKSQSEGCEKYNKAMETAKNAITGYNAICSGMMIYCSSTCEKATAAIEDAEMKAVSYENQPEINALRALKTPVQNQIALCQKYKLNLTMAGVGLINVISEAGRQRSCEDKTTVLDCKKTPEHPDCKSGIDCSIAGNQTDTQCICQRAPNSPGCPGYNGQPSGIAPNNNTDPGPTAETDPDSYGKPNLGPSDPAINAGADGNVAGSTAGAAGAGGGGSGSHGLSGGGTGANKPGGADGNSKGLNTNILSGYEGGGGGGGRGGGSGGRADSAYNAYLPGGAKDPRRGLASKTFGNGEVTSSGAKSNWEKVSERYKDNKPTLMGH